MSNYGVRKRFPINVACGNNVLRVELEKLKQQAVEICDMLVDL
jgi:hypothetical protein